MSALATPARAQRAAFEPAGPARGRLATTALEAAAVLLAPAVLYAVLRLRVMAPVQLPDQSMHTTFILDPHSIFERYQAVFEPTARLREAARVGFLVPARIAYLLFGALPGFLVWRYLLALIALVPGYVLFRRLYGRWAAFAWIAVVMSSPAVVTAWGTDYPDSAALSYLIGAIPALALSWEPGRRRLGWLILAGALLAAAAWSLGTAAPLVLASAAAYFAVRLLRARPGVPRDLAVLVAGGLVLTGLLALGSKLLIGQLDFITPTVKSASFLRSAGQIRLWHSSSPAWAPYDPYLLVPLAVVLALAAVAARPRGRTSSWILFVVLTGALQVALSAYLQFLGNVQILEDHFLSSELWGATVVALATLVVELMGRLPGLLLGRLGRALGALPGLLVLAVALVYELTDPRVPAMTWWPGGAGLVAIIVAASVGGRLASHRSRGPAWAAASAGAVAAVIVIAAALVLTVAPGRAHAPLPRTVGYPTPGAYEAVLPPPPFAGALGGSDRAAIDQYLVVARLPGFVGRPAYRGEQLLTWWPGPEANSLMGPMGIYHAAFNLVSYTFPRLGTAAACKIVARRAAQILFLSTTGRGFAQAAAALAPFRPEVARRALISSGSYRLHTWLVDLREPSGRNVAPRLFSAARCAAVQPTAH